MYHRSFASVRYKRRLEATVHVDESWIMLIHELFIYLLCSIFHPHLWHSKPAPNGPKPPWPPFSPTVGAGSRAFPSQPSGEPQLCSS